MTKYCPNCGITSTIAISNGVYICSVCSNNKTQDQFQPVYDSEEEYENWLEQQQIEEQKKQERQLSKNKII